MIADLKPYPEYKDRACRGWAGAGALGDQRQSRSFTRTGRTSDAR